MPDQHLKILNQMEQEAAWSKFPNTPKSYIVRLPNKANSANALTKSVIKFLQLSKHQAERISNEGRVINTTSQYTDVLGHVKTTGGYKRIPSSMTKGTADISATIKGYSVKIEIKYGKDRVSKEQLKYQLDVRSAGGQYWLVRTFDDFYEQYTEFMNQQKQTK